MRVGIDIGGMSIKIGLVDESYQITAKKVIPTEADKKTPRQIIEAMACAISSLLNENEVSTHDCKGIGIACPGTVDAESGRVIYSNNIDWKEVPILDWMREHFAIPMALANDADAAALGEVLAGAAVGKEHAILITLGTGVGGGVILDKKIFAGPLRGGCELGHTVLHMGGRLCTCGRRGCLETYASATALMKSATAAAINHPQSTMYQLYQNNGEKMDGRMVFEAGEAGDEVACEVLEEYENYLSEGIANFVNIFRPQVVILGGGVSNQKEKLTKPLQEKVKKMCFGGENGEIPPIVTSVLGNDAGIIGAAFIE